MNICGLTEFYIQRTVEIAHLSFREIIIMTAAPISFKLLFKDPWGS